MFENCITFAMCSSTVAIGECQVRYGKDPSYPDNAASFNGPLNKLFELPLLERSTVYYHQANVNNSSSTQLVTRGVFKTGDCEYSLMDTGLKLGGNQAFWLKI